TSTGTCITISASNVSLDLNGHSITGPSGGGDGTSGITSAGQTKLTIKGAGVISNFGRGVDFEGVDGSEVRGVTVSGNFFGFVVNRDFVTPNLSNLSEGNLFRFNTATGNAQHGFTINGGSNNSFLNNVASNNGAAGILLAVGTGNQFRFNTAQGNAGDLADNNP